jgi:hypothetical protein
LPGRSGDRKGAAQRIAPPYRKRSRTLLIQRFVAGSPHRKDLKKIALFFRRHVGEQLV